MSDTRDTIKNAVFDYWVQTTVPLIFDDRFSTKDLVNKVVQYVNNLMGDVRKLTTSDITYIEEIIEELVEGKLDAPATPGTAGQVLTSDGSGGQVWANVGAGEIVVDPTLTVSGAAADAKVTGDEISGLKSDITQLADITQTMMPNLVNPLEIPVDGLYAYVAGGYFGTSTSSKMALFRCKPNTKYTVWQEANYKSGRFEAVTSTDYPAYRVNYNQRYGGASYSSPVTFTTTANDNYIAVRYYDSGVDTGWSDSDALKALMICEGEATAFCPYGAIKVKPEQLADTTYTAIDSRTTALINDALANVNDVYGIRINTDGTVDRMGSAVGKSNDYVIGSSFVGSGVNDFDTFYPWSDMKVCNINYDEYGDPVITYEHEADFKRDGTNGSVYVEIPKFYTKRYLDASGNEVILISGAKYGGFVVEPAFFDSVTGEEIERIYVGAYLTQTGVNAMNSISGVFPESNVSLDAFRTRSGEMYDFVTLQAIQKLMSIEFGRVNFSSIFGGFSYLPWSSSCRADGSVSNTNTGNFKGDSRLANIGVGNTITLATSAGIVQNRTITAAGDVSQVGGGYYRSITFDGDAVNLVDNTTILYCTGQKNGFSDTLTYHTGRTNLNSGSTYSNQFRYRGIEGLWGTLGEIMDGVIVKDLKMYWSNIKANYGDVTKCHRLNFAVPLQNTYTNSQNPLPPQIKKMGWDFRYPTIAFPEVLAEKSEQYYGDLFFSVKNTGPDGQTYQDGDEFIGISSMAWDGHEDNGLYTLRFWSKANGSSWLYGSRAIIRHI